MKDLTQKIIEVSSHHLMPALVFFITIFAGFIIRRILFLRLSRWASKTRTKIDDIIIDAVKGPFLIWCIMLGMYFALEVSNLSQHLVNVIDKALFVLGVGSATLVISSITKELIVLFQGRLQTTLPINTLTQTIARILIVSLGLLTILHGLGISIAPILATLGIGGLAVALALQDTLSNLFSGFHISLARQIKVGDYIKLESGEEGYIIDINWRTTKIKMLPNNVVLVPNSKLTQAIIVNYYLPDKETSLSVNLGVHYKSDLRKVERITCEVAKEVMKEVSGGVATFEPSLRYCAFGDSRIDFSVTLRAKEFTDQYLIKHEFIKRLLERYQKEGIEIPYPTRTIHYEQGKDLKQ